MTPAERDAMREYIDASVTKAVAAIDLSALRGEDGEKGEPGQDGKDAVLDVSALVQEVVALVPIPKDGKDAEPIDRAALVNEVLALIPVPRDGKDAVLDLPALAKEVVALVPLPKDGKDAEPVDRVTLAKDVLALIPVPRDGKDGIASLDDLRAEVAKAVEATVGPTVEKQVADAFDALPILRYKGVFREGTIYKAGECVTWAGAVWNANAETEEKPGEGQTAWTLMVKRGDRGRDLR